MVKGHLTGCGILYRMVHFAVPFFLTSQSNIVNQILVFFCVFEIILFLFS